MHGIERFLQDFYKKVALLRASCGFARAIIDCAALSESEDTRGGNRDEKKICFLS